MIIGDGLNCNEITSSLMNAQKRNKASRKITLLCDEESPIQKVFGSEVNEMIKDLHKNNEVEIRNLPSLKNLKFDGDAERKV